MARGRRQRIAAGPGLYSPPMRFPLAALVLALLPATAPGAEPPVAFMPPWQPAQLKPPSAVGANSASPCAANRLSQPSDAFACRWGSNSQ